MRETFLSAKAMLLRRLPVPIARRRLQYAPCGAPQAAASGPRQLLIDVSVIINNDARTGIQRVVRALLLQLLSHPPTGCVVRPVFATRHHGYRYAPAHFGLARTIPPEAERGDAVRVGRGDFFLGLDLAAHLLPRHQGELARWKRLGAEIHIVVYDLLPVLHPHWFNPKTTRNFRAWLRTIAVFSDSIICISRTVKGELEDWLRRQYALAAGAIRIHTIPLGADIQASLPSLGLPDDVDRLLATLAGKPSVLMVGTLEPRKGHSQVLGAFDKLWNEGHDVHLVIVGKAGWKTEALQHRLHAHPQNRRHLHWLDQASDELLEILYGDCTGVLIASQAEGFGLPLIEAMYHNKPVLARAIPVFREIGDNNVTFFSDASPSGFASCLDSWLARVYGVEIHPLAKTLQQTWDYSAQQLLSRMKLSSVGHP